MKKKEKKSGPRSDMKSDRDLYEVEVGLREPTYPRSGSPAAVCSLRSRHRARSGQGAAHKWSPVSCQEPQGGG